MSKGLQAVAWVMIANLLGGAFLFFLIGLYPAAFGFVAMAVWWIWTYYADREFHRAVAAARARIEELANTEGDVK